MNKVKINEMSYNLVSAKCNICGNWHTYPKNQVSIYANNEGEIVVCSNCSKNNVNYNIISKI
ncbi:hypothetical protein ACR77J_07615 [Tissierella praeacuta]|uniref:hypothetical protein n=1 Tax=Tissierella praeacuta TaxID=43131 RepID=UPI003DA5F74B